MKNQELINALIECIYALNNTVTPAGRATALNQAYKALMNSANVESAPEFEYKLYGTIHTYCDDGVEVYTRKMK